jgi:UDP-glucose 4-epimerase
LPDGYFIGVRVPYASSTDAEVRVFVGNSTRFTKMSKILVVGGAGYIGSHAVLALKAQGFEPLVLDNLVYGHRELVEEVLQVPLVVGDTQDRALLDDLFRREAIAAVMHFAAFTYVGESVTDPARYYRNNVYGTLTLLEAMQTADIQRFVFSSTCAIYGTPVTLPIPEDHSQSPINPYGRTKWMVEHILSDFHQAYGLESVAFRYFNAAGADPEGRLGEDHNPETHLIPLVLQTALGQRAAIQIYGTDYETPDGTCIRDYIHVSDLADAHVLGLDYLLSGGKSCAINLGNGQGFSVREIIQGAERVTGCTIPTQEVARRPGDPPILVGSSEKARQLLGWTPRYTELETILAHAWGWHQKRHG